MNKTIKRNVVVSAVLAIMLCISLIAGATFALFTSESTVNIAVTSGKVNVTATVENESFESTLGSTLAQTSVSYDNEAQTVTFDKIVPGDKATFDIRVHNDSNVSVKYRTIIMCESDNGLFSGLSFSIDGEEYTGRTSITEYADLAVGAQDKIVSVSVSLPYSDQPQNQYQDKTCTISYRVEAVQGNAPVDPTPSNVFEVYNAFDWMSFMKQADEGSLDSEIDTVKLMKDVNLSGIEYGAYALTIPEESTFTIDGNRHTISNLNTSASRNPGTGDSWYASGLLAKVVGEWTTETHGSKLLVKNLTVDNATVTTEHSDWDSAAAVLVGETYALNEIELNNCSVVNSSVTSGAYAAAFIGYDYTFALNNQKITIVGGSVKNSTFIGNDATAALIAINYAPATISGVEISGNTVKGGNGYSAAAVIGTANATFAATDVTLANNTFAMNEGNNNYKGDHKDIGYFYSTNLYEVNGVPYVTSLAQFTAAVNGSYEKVVLAADITNEWGQPYSAIFQFTVSRNLTVDLAGHTFTTGVDLFDVANSGELSLTSSVVGGKLVANSNQGGPVALIQVEKGGTLNINNGIEIDLSKQFVIYDPLYGVINYGTVYMNGGKIVERNGVAITCQSTGSFTMNGGEIVLMSDLRDADTMGIDNAVAVYGDYSFGGTVPCGQIILNAGTFSGEGCAVIELGHELIQGAGFHNNVVPKGNQD